MKLLKIFGFVVGIHVFALILIFANPGCSSTNKPAATASDTTSAPEPAPAAAPTTPAPTGDEVPPTIVSSAPAPMTESPVTAAPMPSDTAVSSAPVGVRFSPTRPGTPAAAALESQPVGDVTPATTYTVAHGDSLWSIAKKNHIKVGELAAANNLKTSSMVKLGQKLIIPGKAMMASPAAMADTMPAKPAAVAAPAPKMSGEPVKHTVKPGETLGGIARKYQVKYGDIAVANNISDPTKIRPGMVLTIPGWQAPAGKSRTPTEKTEAPPKPAEETKPAAPAAGQDLDAGVNSGTGAPPVIQVDDSTPAPGKP
ncbi:MAG TPA: LysM peptidoglycan-binding domain-containing protein [Opitutus sp.]|nr:LysM peptidoglycan-binding domain-containing protein [Opitutus sp.]